MNVTVTPLHQLDPGEMRVWADLQRADPQLHNPFFRPEFAAVVGQLNKNAEVAILREQGEPVGFFPFERQRNTVGCALGSLVADVQGIICRPGLRVDIRDLMKSCGLATWTFDHLLAAQSCFSSFHQYLDDSAYMDLQNGFAAYCEQRKKAESTIIQKAERRKRQMGRELGPLRFEWHSDDPAVFLAICRWKQEQIRQMHYADVFQLQHYLELLKRIGKQRGEAFRGVTSALYAGDQIVAAQFGVQSYEVLSVAIPAFNGEFARYSPGMVLHLELARHAAEHGVTWIELGRGENQTKRSFQSGSIPLAIGAIDLRPLPALMRKAWFGMRNVVYATPLRTVPLSLYRRLRNRLTIRRSGKLATASIQDVIP